MESLTNHSQSPRRGGAGAGFHPRPRVFALGGVPGELSCAEALSRLRNRRQPVLLDSAAGSPRNFSLLAFDPLPGGRPRNLLELRVLLACYRPREGDEMPDVCRHFRGGFIGALAYDLGVEGEALSLPDDPWGLPSMAGGLYCDYLLRDEVAGKSWLILGEEPGDGRVSVELRRHEIEALLATPVAPTHVRPVGPLVRRVPSALHRERVEAVRQRIAQGEVYQANLAHPFERPMEGDPVDLYLALRAASPTPYAGFLREDDAEGRARFALLSCSPELLLEVEPAHEGAGATARTRPIKGTAKRSLDPDRDPDQDRRAARELLSSAKDRAELAMIVDLERNDLGRMARPGGVAVGPFPELESHPAVHHLVADVRARLREDVRALDVLAALFPGGSITGAPKLRSMEVIAELEGEGRGFAFGSLGCADHVGAARFNLLIRTLLWRPRRGGEPDRNQASGGLPGPRGDVLLRVGGGITWGSDPASEDRETLAKAAALLAALGPS